MGGKARLETHPTGRLLHQGFEEAQFRQCRHAADDKLFGELEDQATLLDDLAGVDVADPVVRNVRADEDDISGAKGTDVMADVTRPFSRGYQMQLVLGMKVPADGAERITMRPDFERLVIANLHKLQIRFHG